MAEHIFITGKWPLVVMNGSWWARAILLSHNTKLDKGRHKSPFIFHQEQKEHIGCKVSEAVKVILIRYQIEILKVAFQLGVLVTGDHILLS